MKSARLSPRGPAVAVIGSIMGLLLGTTPGFAAGSGTVDAQVTVSQAAACIELSTTSISFGTLALGDQNAPGTPSITVTNCGEADATLLASGTNAIGAGAAWNLVDSAETCADTLGTDNYHLGLATPLGAPIAGLSTSNKEVGTLAAAATTDQVANISMACPGSSGAGQIMSMDINYLATTVEVPPIVLEPLTADQPTADSAAAFVLPASADYDIAATCVGDPSIACPGGVPSNPLPQVQVQASGVVSTQVPGTNQWNTSATLAVATLQDIPITYSGVSCTVTVNSANGASPTVQGTFLMSFASYPDPVGPTNFIAITNANITGVETADIVLNGGGSCSLLSSFASLFIPTLTDQVEAYIQGNVCGAPDPDVFMACPALP